MAEGRPATMPAKMISEIPLPIPRSVICSPSHMRNIVPVTSETAGSKDESIAGLDDDGSPADRLPAARATAMPVAWKVARATVP